MLSVHNTDGSIKWAVDKMASGQEAMSGEVMGALVEMPGNFKRAHCILRETMKNLLV